MMPPVPGHAVPGHAGPGADRRRRIARGYLLGLICLGGLLLISMGVGSRPVPVAETLRAFIAYDPGRDAHLVVRLLRVPRGLLAVTAGAGLGLAGALMQAVTRNPLAEPGLLGVNGGAALAVVLGASAFGLGAVTDYVWFGFLGAGLAGVTVFLLGRAHESGTDPVRLILAGAGLSIVLGALTSLLVLNGGLEVLDTFRNWSAGALQGRGMQAVWVMVAALVAGGGLALLLAPALDAMAMGQDIGRTLGLNPRRIWALACLSVMLLAGAATATAGPIIFVGLVAPHLARALCGPDNRALMGLSALFAAIMLLMADVVGRVVVAPNEVAAGVIVALLGGPFFIHVVRRFRVARL